MGDGEQRAHGYDFSKVEPARIYTLKEAGELLGMGYGEVWRAQARVPAHGARDLEREGRARAGQRVAEGHERGVRRLPAVGAGKEGARW